MTLRHNMREPGVDPFEGFPTLSSDEHQKSTSFPAKKYLESFYSMHDQDPAMHRVIMFMPCVLMRIKCGDAPGKVHKTYLDVGCGPCIHSAMFYHSIVSEIWLADYASDCRTELQSWVSGKSAFNWSNVANAVCRGLQWKYEEPDKIQHDTREKVRGVLPCDVNNPSVLLEPCPHAQFDIVTTTFCLEAANHTLDGYKAAFRNVAALVAPGGWMVIGGVCSAEFYVFDAKKFQMACVEDADMKQCFNDNGFDMSSILMRRKDDVCVAVCQKFPAETNGDCSSPVTEATA